MTVKHIRTPDKVRKGAGFLARLDQRSASQRIAQQSRISTRGMQRRALLGPIDDLAREQMRDLLADLQTLSLVQQSAPAGQIDFLPAQVEIQPRRFKLQGVIAHIVVKKVRHLDVRLRPRDRLHPRFRRHPHPPRPGVPPPRSEP